MGRHLLRAAMVILLMAAPSGAPAEETAKVTADTLLVDHENRSARFEGHVRGTIGALTVRCDHLELTYNDAGDVDTLVAEGGVSVSRGESRAVAGSARLDAKRGVLILEGKPVVTRGPHRLEGRRIEVYLKSGRLEVLDARGTFSLKKSAGK